MDSLALDKLLLIPANLPPHKELPEDTAPGKDRLAMTSLVADGLGAKAEALDIELNREGKSYTADTVEQLRRQYPDDELWLLVGTDMFLSIQNWHQPERIFRQAGVAAFSRDEEDRWELFEAQSRRLRETFGTKVTTVPLPKVTEISSTQLREALAGGSADRVAEEHMWLPVYGYILKEGLYGSHADLKHLNTVQLRAVSYSMVKAKRLPHIRGTEVTAVALAVFWGVNPETARRAAILHDCTKYLGLEDQLAICRTYGVFLDELEQMSEKFLHSKTGAALAQHVFGEPPQVCDAIYCHTTGKPGMNTLDKILYLADYMEPSRDFDGVEELRKLVWEDLDRAMIRGLEMTMEELKEREMPVHRNTVLALEELKGRQK